MEVRTDRAGKLEAACECRGAIGIARAHAGETDLHPDTPGRLEVTDQLAQNAVGDPIAVRVSQHRQAAGANDALHRGGQIRPVRSDVSRPAALEPAVEPGLHAGHKAA